MEPSAESCETRLRASGLDAPAFQRAVLRQLGELEGVAAQSLAPFRIRATFGDVRVEARLDEQFKRYRHGELEPEHAVIEVAAALGIPGVGLALAGPFPRLAPSDRLPAGAYSRPCPFDPALAIFYVRTLPSGHLPLTVEDVAREWSDRDGAPDGGLLHSVALANLSARTTDVPADSQGEGSELVIGYASGDGLDASRILLPDLLTALADWVEGELCVAIPSRDLLMVIGDADPRFVAEAHAHVAAIFAGEQEPLSPRWYRLGADGLEAAGESKIA